MVICYFRALWECQAYMTTPKKNFKIKLQLPLISYDMQKVNFLPQKVLEILKFKKLYNLIGPEHFQLQHKNYIFYSHVAFVDIQKWCII